MHRSIRTVAGLYTLRSRSRKRADKAKADVRLARTDQFVQPLQAGDVEVSLLQQHPYVPQMWTTWYDGTSQVDTWLAGYNQLSETERRRIINRDRACMTVVLEQRGQTLYDKQGKVRKWTEPVYRGVETWLVDPDEAQDSYLMTKGVILLLLTDMLNTINVGNDCRDLIIEYVLELGTHWRQGCRKYAATLAL